MPLSVQRVQQLRHRKVAWSSPERLQHWLAHTEQLTHHTTHRNRMHQQAHQKCHLQLQNCTTDLLSLTVRVSLSLYIYILRVSWQQFSTWSVPVGILPMLLNAQQKKKNPRDSPAFWISLPQQATVKISKHHMPRCITHVVSQDVISVGSKTPISPVPSVSSRYSALYAGRTGPCLPSCDNQITWPPALPWGRSQNRAWREVAGPLLLFLFCLFVCFAFCEFLSVCLSLVLSVSLTDCLSVCSQWLLAAIIMSCH